jgi:superoxide dismutase, Fe-Mn family
MITRRTALKNLALTTSAIAVAGPALGAEPPAAPATPATEGVFKLPPLDYDYDALEPHIDAETMKIHHDKHHAAYVSKLNAAVAASPGLEKKSIKDILANLNAIPENVRAAIRNNGGGHANHTYFWRILKKKEGAKPTGELAAAIDKTFGSFSKFQDAFTDAALKVFGSGWAWLVLRDKNLVIESTPNQDSPVFNGGVPLVALDVWEHAYYLKYQNRRSDYIQAFYNVIDWDFLSSRYTKRGAQD